MTYPEALYPDKPNHRAYFYDIGRPLEEPGLIAVFNEVVAELGKEYGFDYTPVQSPALRYANGSRIKEAYMAQDTPLLEAVKDSRELLGLIVNNDLINKDIAKRYLYVGLLLVSSSRVEIVDPSDPEVHKSNIGINLKDFTLEQDPFSRILYEEKRGIRQVIGLGRGMAESYRDTRNGIMMGEIVYPKASSKNVGDREKGHIHRVIHKEAARSGQEIVRLGRVQELVSKKRIDSAKH